MVHSTAKNRPKGKSATGGRGSRRLKVSKGRPKPAPKEVAFDDDARREYLTGFSKRKQEKKTAARNRAIEREKEEAKELRQQLRDTRRKQAEENVRQANEFYGADMLDPAALQALIEAKDSDAEPEEQEYTNDEVTSRVVIEDFRPSDDDSEDDREQRKKPRRKHQGEREAEEQGLATPHDPWDDWQAEEPSTGTQMDDRDRGINIFGILRQSKASEVSRKPVKPQNEFDQYILPADNQEEQGSKRFTYETKAARRASSMKQKARRIEKADIGRGPKPTSKGGKRG